MYTNDELISLIESAAAIAGSQRKLAAMMDMEHANLAKIKKGRRTHVLFFCAQVFYPVQKVPAVQLNPAPFSPKLYGAARHCKQSGNRRLAQAKSRKYGSASTFKAPADNSALVAVWV